MPEGLRGRLRLVVQRSAAAAMTSVATFVVILCATTLVAVGVVYGDSVAETGLREAIARRPAADTTVTVAIRASGDELATLQPAIEQQLDLVLRWTGGDLITIAESESYTLPGQRSTRTHLARFGAYEALDQHARLTGGEWPDPGGQPMEVAVSSVVADALGMSVGDEIVVTSRTGPERSLPVRLVGMWRPVDPADAYWSGDPLALAGSTASSSFTTHGPFVVAPEDIGRTASGRIGFEFRALPDFDRLAVEHVSSMSSDTAALERRLSEAIGEQPSLQVRTALDSILAAARQSLVVSRSGVAVITLQYVALAGYALLLVAGLFFEQRRVDTALLRARGAGVGHLAVLSLLEAVLLVLPAVLAAPILAIAVLSLLNLAGPLADTGLRVSFALHGGVWLAVVIAGLAAAAGLSLPALGSERALGSVRRSLARQGTRGLAQRLGLDLALVVLAGVGLWQLRTYGAPVTETLRGEIGLDPLLVAAPALGLLAGAVVALRLLPIAAEVAQRFMIRRRGLVGALGARQVARRPLRYTRSALLLMLAAALGTFAGAYTGTWTRSQADQAAYRTGADIRVEVAPFADLPDWAIGQAYRAVDGVEAALPVLREELDVARGGQLLAIDGAQASGVVDFRPDLSSRPLDELMATLVSGERQMSGIPLGDESSVLALELSADLAPVPTQLDEQGLEFGSANMSPDFRGIAPSLLLRDGDGVVHWIRLPRATVGGGRQRMVVELIAEAGVRPAHPLELLGLQLEIRVPQEVIASGSIELVGVAAARDPSGPWSAVPLDATTWSFGRSNLLFGSAPATVVRIDVGELSRRTIPALAGQTLIEATGIAVGDEIELGSFPQRRRFLVTGVVSAFPTLDPGVPFLVADLPAVAEADAAAGRTALPNEWWLIVAAGRSGPVAQTLGGEPYSAASVTANEQLHREFIADPIALGMVGSLVLGAVAAIIFAIVGFVVSATVLTQERLREFALLQALGVSPGQLRAWISIEQGLLLTVSVLVGTGLGLLLAWVVLPFVTLSREATVVVPPVEVVFPWPQYTALCLLAAVALAATLIVVIRPVLARAHVNDALRSGRE